MADLIGELGLDSRDIEAALGRVSDKLRNAAQQAEGADIAMLGLAAAGVIFAKELYEASRAASAFEKSVNALGSGSGGGASQTFAEIEKQVKSAKDAIDELAKEKGPLDSLIELFRQGFEDFSANDSSETSAAKKAALLEKAIQAALDAEGELAEKVMATNEVLDLQLKGQNEEADLLKVQIKYSEILGAIQKTSNTALAVSVKLEQQKTEELIKQKYARERQGVISEIAEDQAKLAIQNELNDSKNEQIIKDRQADKDQKMYDDQAKALLEEEKEDSEYLYDLEKKRSDEAAKRLHQIQEIAKENKKEVDRLHQQTEITGLAQGGNSLAASEASVRNDFAERKKQAILNHNDAALSEINAQEQQALQGVMAAENRQTPTERREERNAARRETSDAAKQADHAQELRERQSRGQRSREIDDQAKKDYLESLNKLGISDAKEEAAQPAQWSQTDAQNLQKCADGLTPKDG